MSLEIITTQVKTDIIKKKPLNNTVPHITVIFTDTIDDCIPDLHVESKMKAFIQESQRTMDETGLRDYTISLSNTLPFDYLRTQIKENKIGDLRFVIDDTCYDIVLPNGKMVGFSIKDKDSNILRIHEDFLMRII